MESNAAPTTTPTEISSPWGERDLSATVPATYELGPLRLRIYRRGNDVLVHSGPNPPADEAKPTADSADTSTRDNEEVSVPETGFRRFAFTSPVKQVVATPRLPTRPLVARPREPLTLAPGVDTVFFVSIPLEYQLEVIDPASGKLTLLERLPLEKLSDTWFGTPQQGHLAFAIKTRAQRDVASYLNYPDFARAVVTLEMLNHATTGLRFDKCSMHLEHCALYESAKRFWTSPISVAYRGVEHLSEVTYPNGAPKHLKEATQTLRPEVPAGGNLFKRTFGRVSANLFANV